MAEEAERRENILKRVKNCVVSECKLLANCVCSASPDRTSASVLFLVMFATSLTVTFSRQLMASRPGRFPNYVVPWLIISFEVASILSLVLMWCYARNRPSERGADVDLQPWHRFIRRNIKLFGIVPFYFAIFVFDVFRLNADLTCIDAWVACTSNVIRVEHITDLLYPVARTVHLCIELIVCVKFNAKDFYQNSLVLVGLAIVQATNLSCWLDALVDESHVFASDRNWTYEVSRCFNETGVNVSDHYRQCFSRKTGEYKLLESASPYLYPFIMEYLMLVIESVADWFFSDAARHDATPPSNALPGQPIGPINPINPVEHARAQSTASSVAIDENDGTKLERLTSYGSIHVEQQQADVNISRASSSNSVLREAGGHQDEISPLIATGSHLSTSTAVSPSFDLVEFDADMARGRPMWYDRCPRLFFSGILPSIASFLFLILGIYNFCLDQTGYRNIFVCFRSGYWLALMLAPLVGYAACRQFPSGPMNPNGFEYFVILSCIGPILQSVFTIVANVSTHGLIVPMGMFFTEEVTNILQICTQIMFYAYAKSVRIQANEYNEPEFHRKRSILMGVLSYFAVCNAAIWVEDSFIETRSSVISWQRRYFDNWPLIYNIFNPLSLMFRFNSCLLFLDVYFDKRRNYSR